MSPRVRKLAKILIIFIYLIMLLSLNKLDFREGFHSKFDFGLILRKAEGKSD